MIPDSDDPRWQRWRHPLVRDLAWVLASPPLLAAPTGEAYWMDAAWGDRAFTASADWLATLDHDPALLAPVLARRQGRLGSYFEGLLTCWLAWPGNPLYRLHRQGLPVRDGKRTVGEMDFLVEDRASGELQHWEVAVKFYLGIATGGAHAHWIGPGQRDRLDIKVEHLLRHQLALSRSLHGEQALSEAGLGRPRPACLLRGRLFYPSEVDHSQWQPHHAAPGHLSGWWMPLTAFADTAQDPGIRWIRLPREHWLAPVAPGSDACAVPIGDPLTAPQLVEAIRAATDNRATAVVGLAQGREVTRGFITSDSWPRNPDPA